MSPRYEDDMRLLRREPPPPPPRNSISARPEPESAKILDGHRRVGDAQRLAYVEHLNDLHARGYLPAEEHEARKNAALEAEVEYDLNRLISDTPGLAGPKRAQWSLSALISWFTANKNSTALAAFVFVFWGIATIAWMSIIPAVLGVYAAKMDAFQTAGAVFFIATGVLSVIAEIITLVNYADV